MWFSRFFASRSSARSCWRAATAPVRASQDVDGALGDFGPSATHGARHRGRALIVIDDQILLPQHSGLAVEGLQLLAGYSAFHNEAPAGNRV